MRVPPRKSPFPMDLILEHKGKLNASTVTAVAMDLLQYLMYQRQQLPLPVPAVLQGVRQEGQSTSHILEDIFGEPENEQSSSLNSNMDNELCSSGRVNATAIIRSNLVNSRARQAHMRQQRLWQKYQNKAQKFVTLYGKISQAIESQLKSGCRVEAVRFAFGCSSITSREVYTLHFPATAAHSPLALPVLPQSGRSIMLALMRSLMSNDEFLTFVNTRSGLKKIWILVLKPEEAVSNYSEDGLEWIPRLQYTVGKAAKSVDIRIKVQEEPTSVTTTSGIDVFTTPPKLPPPVGRRVLPSLTSSVQPSAAHMTNNDCAEKDTALSHDSLVEDMEQFELSPLEFSDHGTPSVPSTNATFVKPFAPPLRSVRKNVVRFESLCAVNEFPVGTPVRSVNYDVLDMVETPVTSGPHPSSPVREHQKCESRQGEGDGSFSSGDMVLQPSNTDSSFMMKTSVSTTRNENWFALSCKQFQTPQSHCTQVSAFPLASCTKVLDMVETPVQPTHNFPTTCTKVLDMVETPVQPTHSFPTTCTKVLDMVETPVQPTHSFPTTCTKVLDMVETPVQPTHSFPTTCTKVLDMVETPVQPTHSFPTTCTKVLDMVETPVQPTYNFPTTCTKVLDMVETPVQPTHSFPTTCTKVLDMVETPVQPTHSFPTTCTKVLDMVETPVQSTHSFPTTCTKVFDMVETPVQSTHSFPTTCTKVIDMVETPVQSTHSFPTTCTKVLDMVETPVQPTRSLPSTCSKICDVVETPLQRTQSLPICKRNFSFFKSPIADLDTRHSTCEMTGVSMDTPCSNDVVNESTAASEATLSWLRSPISKTKVPSGDFFSLDASIGSDRKRQCLETSDYSVSEVNSSALRGMPDSSLDLSAFNSPGTKDSVKSISMDFTGADDPNFGTELLNPNKTDCDNNISFVDMTSDSVVAAENKLQFATSCNEESHSDRSSYCAMRPEISVSDNPYHKSSVLRSEGITSRVAAKNVGGPSCLEQNNGTSIGKKLVWYELSIPLVGFLDKPVPKPTLT